MKAFCRSGTTGSYTGQEHVTLRINVNLCLWLATRRGRHVGWFEAGV